jgi:AraC family transcriptional regulator of adaptative response/methylated-DNA-[protein]-cysteine methyltransferase
MTPGAYRAGGRGAQVRYAVAATPHGAVLVAATARGLCAVSLGDDAGALERALAEEFPAAERERVDLAALAPDDPLAAWLAAVRARFEGATPGGVLGTGGAPGDADPLAAAGLDVGGTPLQRRVWAALCAIPAGETRTYAELAAAAGAPHAVRAVASACARNRIALVIPCHRVVRSGGATGEYRWGADRKRELLRRERETAAAGRPPS